MKPKHYELSGTHYWVYNDNSKLPVMIMIHGLRGTHHGLELIAERLNGFRIIVPDLPGFGVSKKLVKTHSIPNYAEWMNKFIDDLKLSKPPVLLGHSFGSLITSRFATKHSGKISEVVLVNPIAAPALEGNRVIASRISALYYWLSQALPEPFGTALLRSKIVTLIMSISLTKTRNKKLRKWIHNEHLTHFNSFKDRQMVSEAFMASITNNVRQDAPDITARTLLIAGDIDDITPVEEQRELVNVFPDAQLVVLKGVGHLTHYEKPDEIVAAINNFLKD